MICWCLANLSFFGGAVLLGLLAVAGTFAAARSPKRADTHPFRPGSPQPTH